MTHAKRLNFGLTVLLAFVFACSGSRVLAERTVADTATQNLRMLSESAKPYDAAAVRELIKTGADGNVIDRIDTHAEKSIPPSRLVTSILWFENKAGSQAEHWRYAIKGSLQSQIIHVKTIQLREGVNYARTKLGIEKGSALSADQARRIGEYIESQRVIWGSYQRLDDTWQVSLFLLNVATGELTGPLTAVSTDWYDIRDKLIEQILEQLKIKPSEDEQKKLIRRETTSPQALEWHTKAYAGQAENRAFSELEEYERKAIQADPRFAEACLGLASTLASQGKIKQAEEMVRHALEIRPDSAAAHLTLGMVLLFQDKSAQGEIELNKALQLEPDEGEILNRLAEISLIQGKFDQAIAYEEKAILLGPMESVFHAHLGLAYVQKRDRDKAMKELQRAQQLFIEDAVMNINTEQMLCQAYDELGEVPLAVEHYETFVTLGRKQGANPQMIRSFESRLKFLKASLTPTFVEASMPKTYTQQSLQEELRRKLTPEELQRVVNPVAGSPQIKRWAMQLTEGADSELNKAKAIFDGLTRCIQRSKMTGTRTAQEVYAAWNDPNESFNCQEYANLYLALAREVDLKAFYVHLERDCRDKYVFHDCVIVFLDGKGLLVDPAYRWFGVPHKEFVVLDDMQTVAHHFFQPAPGQLGVSQCRLAAKLHPDFAWGQLHLARALYNVDKCQEARKALENAEHLDPGRWDAFEMRGYMAVIEKDWDTAITVLRKAIELNPEAPASHCFLGDTLAGLGRQEEAREEYRACLQYDMTGLLADRARRAIVQINEKTGIESDKVFDTVSLMLAAEKGDIETVKRLIAGGADVNASDKGGAAPLMVASQEGHTEIVKLLLKDRADVNAAVKNGATPLWFASQEGHADVVKLLLDAKADVNAADKDNVTGLWMASQNGHVEVVKLLLTAGADPNAIRKTDNATPLWQASWMGHADVVNLLLEAKADVNAAYTDGRTSLWMASQNGYTDVVKLLLKAKAAVDAARITDGVTGLMMASQNGHTEIVKLLLEAGADVNAADKTNGISPLYVASENNYPEAVKLLLKARADVNAVHKTDGVTPLNIASDKGLIEIVKLLLGANADVNAAHKTYGTTPLFMASQNGHSDVVKLLLEAGADVNAARRTDGVTPLWQASWKGYVEIVKLLLEMKADVNAVHTDGRSSLWMASQENHAEVVKLLLEARANVNIPRKTDGVTGLFMASGQGHIEVVKLLLEARADVNVTRKTDGVTPLWMVSQNGHLEVIKLLLEAGADVNAAYRDGATPLFMASQNGHSEIVKLLLGAGADVNSASRTEGITPLWQASKQGHAEVVKLLLEAKADVNTARKADGATALWLASQKGNTGIVKLLLEAKADVNTKAHITGKDYTPLSIAQQWGHTEIIKLLEEYGAKEQ